MEWVGFVLGRRKLWARVHEGRLEYGISSLGAEREASFDPAAELAVWRLCGQCPELAVVMAIVLDRLLRKAGEDVAHSLEMIAQRKQVYAQFWEVVGVLQTADREAYLADSADRLPPELLQWLAEHPESSVRAVVAARKDLPVALLSQLAHEPNSAVRSGVAGNPKTPRRLLELLAQDGSMNVRELARHNLHSLGL